MRKRRHRSFVQKYIRTFFPSLLGRVGMVVRLYNINGEMRGFLKKTRKSNFRNSRGVKIGNIYRGQMDANSATNKNENTFRTVRII